MKRAVLLAVAVVLTVTYLALAGLGDDHAPHNMTANDAPEPFVALASTEYSGSFSAYKAFDGLLGTQQYWVSSANTGWLQIDLGSGNEVIIGTYALQANSIPEPTRMPKDWTLLGSNNGTDFDTLDTVSGETAWGDEEKRTYTCDVVTTAYRYFRLNVTLNNGHAYVQMGELFLYEGVPGGFIAYPRPRGLDGGLGGGMTGGLN